MEQTTIGKLAELIRATYYRNGFPSDDASFSLVYFAEMVAMELAQMAYEDSINNSNQGEGTYANDQFISTFKSVPVLLGEDGEYYSTLPSTPAGLPNGQEIAEVKINGNKCPCIPIRNKNSFMQDIIGYPCGIITYKVEGSELKYKSGSPLFSPSSTATIKMVGAVSGDSLLNSGINIPKNYEGRIMTNILARLIPLKQIPDDNLNNAVSNPT